MRSSLAVTLGAGLAVIGATLTPPDGLAAATEFYAGKTIEIIVPSGAGSDSYDTLSRLVARHIGRHLAGNPNVIVENMPGAGGIRAANQLYNIAPRDGTVIGMPDEFDLSGPAVQGARVKSRRHQDELDRPHHQQ